MAGKPTQSAGPRKNLGKSNDPYDDMPIGGDDMDMLHWEFEQLLICNSKQNEMPCFLLAIRHFI